MLVPGKKLHERQLILFIPYGTVEGQEFASQYTKMGTNSLE